MSDDFSRSQKSEVSLEKDENKEPGDAYMLKAQLMKEAQKHCDSSFVTVSCNSLTH